MTMITRRAALSGMLAAGGTLLAGCGNGVGSPGAAAIDARVAATMNFLYSNYPATTQLRDKASGILVMPVMTKAALGAGGSFGRGSLLVNGQPIDYYSAAQASLGFQLGAQQYAQVLFFMTNDALFRFRSSPGWEAGGDIEYALNDRGANLSASTTTSTSPVVGVIFGQAGLMAGASIEGTKYTRIIP